jgi:hypothetical protein
MLSAKGSVQRARDMPGDRVEGLDFATKARRATGIDDGLGRPAEVLNTSG